MYQQIKNKHNLLEKIKSWIQILLNELERFFQFEEEIRHKTGSDFATSLLHCNSILALLLFEAYYRWSSLYDHNWTQKYGYTLWRLLSKMPTWLACLMTTTLALPTVVIKWLQFIKWSMGCLREGAWHRPDPQYSTSWAHPLAHPFARVSLVSWGSPFKLPTPLGLFPPNHVSVHLPFLRLSFGKRTIQFAMQLSYTI